MSFSIWKRILRSEHGLSLGICILLQGMLMAVAIPLLPIVLSERIGLEKNAVTLYFLINTLTAIVVTLGTGYLSDGKIARHKLVIVCGIIAALGYAGISVATQPVHAFIVGPITVALNVLFPQLFAVAKAGVLADWERSAQVTGTTALRTLFSLGFIVGTGLGSWLIQIVDIQAIFLLIAFAILLLVANAGRVLHNIETAIGRRNARVDENQPQSHEAKQIALPLYALVVPLLALIVLRGADSTRGVYLSLVIFQIFNDASIAPLMFGITAAAELLTMGMLGALSARIGEKATISIGALVGAVYFLILSSSQALPLLYGIHLLYAVFNAVLLGVAMAYVQNLLSHRAGMGGSLYMAVLNVGSLVGILSPLLVTGYSQAIFIIPAVLCVGGAALLMVGDRTEQIRRRLREAVSEAPMQEVVISAVPPVAAESEA